MGCASSKILTRSGSFQQEVKQSKQRKANGLEELLISKDGGDQFLALLSTANTAARRIKASSLREEPERNVEATMETTNSKTMDLEVSDSTANPENELTNVETINAWELLAGLEDGKEEEQQQQREHHHNVESSNMDEDEEYKFIVSNDSIPSTSSNSIEDNSNGAVTQTRSIRTVEDYDATVAGNYSLEEGKYMTEISRSTGVQVLTGSDSLIREYSTVSAKEEDNGVEQEEKHEELEMKSIGTEVVVQENVGVKLDRISEKGPKRKAMARELTALKVPAFEFSRTGSLREWLKLGGQVFSPGSYVTPKFGNFVSQYPRNGETGYDHNVFDPDLIAQFEQVMKQLTMEEEFVLKQIIESLEKGHEGDTSRVEISEEHMQV